MNFPILPEHQTESALAFEIPVRLELDGHESHPIAASVRRVNTGFLQLSSPTYLLADTRLYVLFDRQRISAEVVYCKPENGTSYLVGARMNPESTSALRREPRVPLDLSAKVTAPNLPGPIHSRVVDMSRNGLGLTLPFELPVGIGVTVELSYGIAFGEVRHCTEKSPGCWRAGLFLQDFVSRNEGNEPSQREEETPVGNGHPGFLDRIKKLFRAKAGNA